jgi:AcrR family transcriptional regulator
MVLNRRSADSGALSRRASRRAREAAQRRDDILAGAADVFARKGYDGAQMAEIAAAAEVSLASLYAEFRSKDDVYQAAIEAAGQRVLGTLRGRVDAVTDPAEAPLVLIDTLFECLEQDIGLLRLVLSGTAGVPWRIRADRRSPVTDEFRAFVTATCRRAVRRGALRGLDGAAVAHALMGGVLQAAAHAIDHEPGRALTELAPRHRAIFARLLDGAAR